MSIIPLISSWEQYIQTRPTANLQDFGRWLQSQPAPTPPAEPASEPASPTSEPVGPATNPQSDSPFAIADLDALVEARRSLAININLDASAIGTLFVARLNMINHFLSKPVIRKLGFAKDAEFSVLIQVHLMDRPNKKELCRQLLIENSTGVEITRRLAKKGLLRETIDPNDRRSSRLSLTEKGQRLLKDGYAGFQSIHKTFLAPLSPAQKLQFVAMLTRLHEYHSAQLLRAAKPA